ncbi:MAG: ABC transporter permease [Mycobacteriaceae bacterium]|nr:ABC transporter permease [Mycobacteriaceae bacterium]
MNDVAVKGAVDVAATGSLPAQALIEAGRLARSWSRQADVVTSTFVLPVLLLLMFDLVLGKVLGATGDGDPIYGFVPMIAVAATMYGAMGTGQSLYAERESGLLRRFWVMPIHRSAGLLGRLLAECGRALIATVVVLVLGFVLGLRFEQGVAGALGALAVPVLVIAGFAPVVIACGVSRAGHKVVEVFAIVVLVGMFFNSGFVPLENYPGWLRPVVAAQPMSCAIEAMRGFTLGGPTAVPLLQTAAWSIGLAAAFGALAVRGYRNAARA